MIAQRLTALRPLSTSAAKLLSVGTAHSPPPYIRERERERESEGEGERGEERGRERERERERET